MNTLRHRDRELPNPSPDLSFVQVIHRGHHGFVSFHRKRGEELEDLCSLPVCQLCNAPARLLDELTADAFFSINTFSRPGFGGKRSLFGLPPARRRAADLLYLNCCFADLDCYNVSRDSSHTIEKLLHLETSGALPPISVIVRSGRGVWPMWLLRDGCDGHSPPRADSRARGIYVAIQTALGCQLAPLGADAAARDPARITRIPSSLNSRSNERVSYELRRREDGTLRLYTLQELQRYFERSVDLSPARSRSMDPMLSAKRRAARQVLLQSRVERLLCLHELRGGFRQGTRNNALFLYAQFLQDLKVAPKERETRLAWLVQTCVPSLSNAELRATTWSTSRYFKWKSQTISDRLQITPGESIALFDRVGKTWPPAQSFVEPPQLVPLRGRGASEARRRLIKQLIGTGSPPTCRQMQALLAREGLTVSHMTIHRDYVTLRLEQGSTSSRASHERHA